MFLTKTNKNGSALFNVLVSLGIIALLTTISIPYIKKYQPNLQLNASARELASNLRYTQQLTITEQVVHFIYLDVVNNSYEVRKNSATSTILIRTIGLPTDIYFEQISGLTDNKIYFNSYGGVNESGDIILKNNINKETNISIKPSGYVQLQQ